MTSSFEALRAALQADILAHPRNEMVSVPESHPGHADHKVSKAATQLGLTAAHWAFNGDLKQVGEVVIRVKESRVVIPVDGTPFLEVIPPVHHRFESETEKAMCVSHADALEIAFEDDAHEIAETLNVLGLHFTPKIQTNILVFDKINLAAA